MTIKVTVKTEKIAELGLKNLSKSNGSELKVGWFPKNKYTDSGIFVAQVASINEFGGGYVPSRPFMRPAIIANSNKWNKLEEILYRKVLTDGMSVEKALEILSLTVEGDIKDSIRSVTTPELKESTINARRRKLKNKPLASSTLRKPLIDTSIMINTITRVIDIK